MQRVGMGNSSAKKESSSGQSWLAQCVSPSKAASGGSRYYDDVEKSRPKPILLDPQRQFTMAGLESGGGVSYRLLHRNPNPNLRMLHP